MKNQANSMGRVASRTLAATLLAGVALPGIAFAQGQSGGESTTLDPVFITAERRDQNMQEVSISGTVLQGEELNKKGVQNIDDIQHVAPSVAINTYNRSTFINIRGVGIAQSAPTSNPGVAYYVDGVLIPHEQFIGQSFFDIGAIEVLRGPQGTLTGQNSTGGAVYVTTPAPQYNNTSGRIEGTAGTYGHYRGLGVLNIGGDNVAARLAFVHDQRDSFTDNIGPSPSEPGNYMLDAVRLNVAVRNFDGRLRTNLRFEGFDYETDNNAVKRRNDTVSTDPFVIQEDALSFMNQRGYRASVESRYAVTDGVDFRALVSYQNGYTRDQTDGDRTDFEPPRPPGSNVGRVSNADTRFKTFIGEVNLLSTHDGPVQWVVGGFTMNEYVPVSLFRDNNNTTDFVSSTSTIIATAQNKSDSVFGQVNWFVTDAWELIAGARHSRDTQAYNRIAVPGPPQPLPNLGIQNSEELTGRLGVSYHTMDNGLYYFTVSKGYKAGGVNLTPNTPNFEPETNLVFEAGFKVELMDDHLRVNGAVYRSDYSDIQLASLLNGLPVTQNASSGEATGAELELTGRFGPWAFNAGAGYLKAEFSNSACISDTNSPGTDTGCPTGLRLAPAGRVLPFSPEWTVNAGIQYDIEIGGVFYTPRIQWSHISEQNATPFPTAATIVPARDIVDFRVTADVSEELLLEFFVQNVFDETYIASQIQNSSSATGGHIYGAPRTFGIRAVRNFGQ